MKACGMLPLQVKEYPGYNFIGLIFGHGNEALKRLEKVCYLSDALCVSASRAKGLAFFDGQNDWLSLILLMDFCIPIMFLILWLGNWSQNTCTWPQSTYRREGNSSF